MPHEPGHTGFDLSSILGPRPKLNSSLTEPPTPQVRAFQDNDELMEAIRSGEVGPEEIPLVDGETDLPRLDFRRLGSRELRQSIMDLGRARSEANQQAAQEMQSQARAATIGILANLAPDIFAAASGAAPTQQTARRSQQIGDMFQQAIQGEQEARRRARIAEEEAEVQAEQVEQETEQANLQRRQQVDQFNIGMERTEQQMDQQRMMQNAQTVGQVARAFMENQFQGDLQEFQADAGARREWIRQAGILGRRLLDQNQQAHQDTIEMWRGLNTTATSVDSLLDQAFEGAGIQNVEGFFGGESEQVGATREDLPLDQIKARIRSLSKEQISGAIEDLNQQKAAMDVFLTPQQREHVNTQLEILTSLQTLKQEDRSDAPNVERVMKQTLPLYAEIQDQKFSELGSPAIQSFGQGGVQQGGGQQTGLGVQGGTQQQPTGQGAGQQGGGQQGGGQQAAQAGSGGATGRQGDANVSVSEDAVQDVLDSVRSSEGTENLVRSMLPVFQNPNLMFRLAATDQINYSDLKNSLAQLQSDNPDYGSLFNIANSMNEVSAEEVANMNDTDARRNIAQDILVENGVEPNFARSTLQNFFGPGNTAAAEVMRGAVPDQVWRNELAPLLGVSNQ